jgi:hypothetical protein
MGAGIPHVHKDKPLLEVREETGKQKNPHWILPIQQLIPKPSGPHTWSE